MVDSMLAQLAGTGVVGAFLVLSLLALRAKDASLTAEKNSRIEDAQKFNALCLSLQKEVMTAIGTLGKIADTWEKKEADRQTLARELALRTTATPYRGPTPQGPEQ